jgi:hypothetical protein
VCVFVVGLVMSDGAACTDTEICQAGGGVWRTSNYRLANQRVRWVPLLDQQNVSCPSVGTLAMGQRNKGWMAATCTVPPSQLLYGYPELIGLVVSQNGGNSWSRVNVGPINAPVAYSICPSINISACIPMTNSTNTTQPAAGNVAFAGSSSFLCPPLSSANSSQSVIVVVVSLSNSTANFTNGTNTTNATLAANSANHSTATNTIILCPSVNVSVATYLPYGLLPTGLVLSGDSTILLSARQHVVAGVAVSGPLRGLWSSPDNGVTWYADGKCLHSSGISCLRALNFILFMSCCGWFTHLCRRQVLSNVSIWHMDRDPRYSVVRCV